MEYEIDRKAASRLLKVSIRTVDRYIVNAKISHEKRDGRIWLNKKEILNLKKKKNVDINQSRYVSMSTDKNDYEGVDTLVDNRNIGAEGPYERNKKDFGEGTPLINNFNEKKQGDGIYQKLYEELKEELQKKQDRLEGANYRVGQLEGQLKESVPLLEHRKIIEQEAQLQEELKMEAEAAKEEARRIQKKIGDEKLAKNIYLVILFIILFLQPLWLFLSLR